MKNVLKKHVDTLLYLMLIMRSLLKIDIMSIISHTKCLTNTSVSVNELTIWNLLLSIRVLFGEVVIL
jgi:hypothetical protein